MARKLILEIIADPRQAQRGFAQASRSAENFQRDLGKTARGALAATVNVRGLGRALAFGSAQFLGGAGIVFAVKSFSEAASNMNEQMAKTNVVFGKSTEIVQTFAEDALGLAKDQALEFASTFGALLRPMGVTASESAKLSVELTKLGVDLASFSNTPVADSLAAIRSGLVGEVEPLRRYGILLSEARVQQEALRETGKAHAQSLRAQEKVQARIALIFRDSTQASGDYSRTIGGLANQQRELGKNVRNLEISLGTALNPTILRVTKNLNDWLGKTENQKKLTDDLSDAVKAGTAIVRDVAAVFSTVNRITGGLTNTIKLLAAAFVVLKIKAALVRFGLLATEIKAVGAAAATTQRNVTVWSSGIANVGTQAETARGKVSGLAGALRGLPTAIGITLGVDLLVRQHLESKNVPEGARLVLGDKINGKGPGNTVDTPEGKMKLVEINGKVYAIPVANLTLRNPLKGKDFGATLFGQATPPAPAIPATRANPFALTAAQRRAISLSGDPTLAALRAQAEFDRAQIAALQRRFAAGKLGAKNYTAAVVKYKNDLAAQEAQIESILSSQTSAEKTALKKRQKAEDAAAKARLIAIHALIPQDVSGSFLLPAGTNFKQQFGIPQSLQLAQARADALGLSDQSKRIAVKIRAAAQKALKSGRLGFQGMLDAWNTIGQINDQLKQQGNRVLGKFKHVDPNKLLAGFGLTAAQIRALAPSIAQVGFHGAVPGRTSLAFAGGGAGGDIVVHTSVILDGRDIAQSTTRHQQKASKRRASSRRGPYAGRH